MSDANSIIGKAVTAAAPGLASVCRRCWPKSCSWMDCWSEEHSLESWRAYQLHARDNPIALALALPLALTLTRRAYNYPHVTAVYWSLYRLGR